MTKGKMKCPACGFERLIDTNSDIKSEAYEEGKYPVGWEPDYVQKCHQCKKQIGIKKIS